MVITQTPLRVSFFGGGTDYPEYFELRGGEVLSTSIDKYSYVTVSRLCNLFEYRLRISYSKTELVNDVGSIIHPAVREVLKFMGMDGGLEINYISDLPARTGLGSSSSFTVGLLKALYAFAGKTISPKELAEQSIHIERVLINERVGCQDQYAAAFGGFLHISFNDKGTVVSPITISTERIKQLQDSLCLVYTGITRYAHEVLKEQIEKTKTNIPILDEMKEQVKEAISILYSDQDIAQFGKLLHDGWLLKKRLSNSITNATIEEAYNLARRNGAIGGKLLGAGGGGFLLLFVEKGMQSNVADALAPMPIVPFLFDSQGSQVIFYRPRNGE